MKRTGMASLVVVVLWMAGAAWAQKPEGPRGGPVSDKVVIDVSGDPKRVWVTYENYQPLKRPEKEAPRITPPIPLSFLDVCYYTETYQDKYYLLVTGKRVGAEFQVDKYLGWVPRAYLLLEGKAIQNEVDRIFYKGLIVNSLESLAKSDPRKVQFAKSPTETVSDKDDPHRLYDTYFVYAEADGYALLGMAPNFSETAGSKHAREIMLGWLPKERLCPWRTREGCEWEVSTTLQSIADPARRRTRPGRIYADDKLPRQALKDDKVPFLFEETLNEKGESVPLAHNAPRYPILDKMELTEGTLFKVGGIGGLKVAGGIVLNPSQTNELQTLWRGWADVEKITEILFVVDDTDSMEEWFKAVGSVIEQIVREVQENPRLEVRVAVTYYNDSTQRQPNPEPVKTMALVDARKGGTDIVQELRSHKVHDGDDEPEMLYRGIVEGIDAAKFHSYARKVVIVVGDCGDISAFSHRCKEGAEKDYPTKYNKKEIVSRLVPGPNDRMTPINFFALHVKPSKDDFTKAFQKQMLEITELYQEELARTKHEGAAEYFAQADTDRAAALVKKHLDRLVEYAQARQKQLRQLAQGQFRTVLSPDLKERVNQVLRKYHKDLTLDRLAETSSAQMFQEGYVWLNTSTGVPQLNKRLWITDHDLQLIVKVLDNVEKNARLNRDKPIADVLAQLIVNQAGDLRKQGARIKDEEIPQLSISDLLAKATGLQFQSAMLRTPLQGLRERSDRLLNTNEFNYLMMKRDLLQGILDNKRYEFEPYDDVQGGVAYTNYRKKGDPVGETRGYTREGEPGVLWYWLDYEREWP